MVDLIEKIVMTFFTTVRDVAPIGVLLIFFKPLF
jgi:hypothetical protein